MREGIAYKIVGGVRFYERKEIKARSRTCVSSSIRMTTSA